MRIALVLAAPFPSPQGSQVFVGEMASALAGRGHEVHLVTYGQGREVRGGGFVHHRARRLPLDDAVRSGPRPMKPVLDVLLAQLLCRLDRRYCFDLLLCHNYEAAAVGLMVRRLRGVPVVYYSHNVLEDELPTYFRLRSFQAVARIAGKWLDVHVPSRADQAVALCEFTAEQLLAAGVKPERLVVAAPAVRDGGPARPANEARRALGLPQAPYIIGYAGNLDAYQNLETLAAACSLLLAKPRRRPLLWLVVTHEDGRRLDAIVRRWRLGGAVRVACAQSYARARLAMEACDVLVLPRRWGSGFPIKLLNYMSLARPVVTCGCGRKALCPGVEGLVVPDGDPVALAAALEEVEQDAALAERLARAARAKYLRCYTWEAVLPLIEQTCERARRANPLFGAARECKAV
ncbi:MAG: glycosyltransferase [Candidatus Dadabacteria bacterium]|nr:MAG: glycosyltransferase [Candidatus Dadabacteria bacterium]